MAQHKKERNVWLLASKIIIQGKMEDNTCVSIVVPIYKVELYLKRCVDSLLAQTYKNIEIILVDDGSPDGCGYICDEYAKIDSRIKVIHKYNGGLSDARNAGIDVATGEYIAFVDSDDYVTSDYIQYLHDLLILNEGDIAVCSYYTVENMEQICPIHINEDEVEILSNIDASKRLFGMDTVKATVSWNKLYKTELLRRNKFPKGRIHEDEATTYRLYYEANRIIWGNRECYAYYQNPDGIMGARKKCFREDAVWAWGQQLYFYNSNNEVELATLILNRLYTYLICFCIEKEKNASIFLKKLLIWDSKNKYVSIKTRMVAVMALYCPYCYRLYYRFKKSKGSV